MGTNITKRKHAAAFKAQVAREAMRAEKTVTQIASEYSIHTTQVKQWKKEAEANLIALFSENHTKQLVEKDQEIERLHVAIGKREVELDWLKKRLGA
jgi:transposase